MLEFMIQDSEIDSHPLTQAVVNGDLDEVKQLVKDESISHETIREIPLLNLQLQCAFYEKRWEIFTFLLDQDIDLNLRLDKVRDTLLIHITRLCDEERYLLALIDRDADVNCQNNEGDTFLQYAARNCSAKTGQAALAKGANVNIQNNKGETPLFLACQNGNVDWVHMLLYHGASATISTHCGQLPLTITGVNYTREQEELLELLFDHTFDEGGVTLPLPALVDGMMHSPFLVDAASKLIYDQHGLEYLQNHLHTLHPASFRVLIQKFPEVVQDLIDVHAPFDRIVEVYRSKCALPSLTQVLVAFIESAFAADFVHSLTQTYPTVAYLVKGLQSTDLDLEEITKIVTLLLSYGLEVCTCDLDVVYEYYGFCELFKMLLHMDVEYFSYWVVAESRSMALLYYDVTDGVEEVLQKLPLSVNLLGLFDHRVLKERQDLDEDLTGKIEVKLRALPDVPLLVELSRNVVRRFIVARFRVKKCRDFYTILDRLPIDRITRSIISLERKLY